MEFLSKYTLEYIKKKTWNLIFSKVPNFSKVADLSPKKRFRKQWDLIIGVLAGVWPGFFVPKICNPPKHITQKDETSIWSNQNKPPVWLLGGVVWILGWVIFVFFFGGKIHPRWPVFFHRIRSQQLLEVLWSSWLRARNVFVCWVPPQARRPRKKTPRGFFVSFDVFEGGPCSKWGGKSFNWLLWKIWEGDMRTWNLKSRNSKSLRP